MHLEQQLIHRRIDAVAVVQDVRGGVLATRRHPGGTSHRSRCICFWWVYLFNKPPLVSFELKPCSTHHEKWHTSLQLNKVFRAPYRNFGPPCMKIFWFSGPSTRIFGVSSPSYRNSRKFYFHSTVWLSHTVTVFFEIFFAETMCTTHYADLVFDPESGIDLKPTYGFQSGGLGAQLA